MNPQTPSRPRRVTAAMAVALLGAGLLLGGCGDDESSTTTTTEATTGSTADASTEPATDGIEVDGAWARPSPMVDSAAAVYLEITNGGTEDDALVGVSVPATVAPKAEMHETRAADSDDEGSMGADSTDSTEGEGTGMMEMVPVDRIDVPVGETVALEPGGLHIMLLDLVEPLEAGDEIEVTLTFENAGEIVVTAVVGDGAP